MYMFDKCYLVDVSTELVPLFDELRANGFAWTMRAYADSTDVIEMTFRYLTPVRVCELNNIMRWYV